MPKVDDTPVVLRQLHFLGLDLDVKSGNEATGECPFCEEPKFSVNVETTKWQCFAGSCQKSGNFTTFLSGFWELCHGATSTADYATLCGEKGILYPDTPRRWGVARSVLTGEWLIPGWTADGRLSTIYRHCKEPGGKMVFMPCPDVGHGLHGVPLLSGEEDTIFVAEGWGDAMALWEVLSRTKNTQEGLALTSNKGAALTSACGVVAVPGANVWLESWGDLMSGKVAALLYDNDWPKVDKRTGDAREPAGLTGSRRAAGALALHPKPPREVKYLKWGDEGYSRQWPSGYDVRDWLTGRGVQ